MLTVIFFLLCFGFGVAVSEMTDGEMLWLALRRAGYAIDTAASDMEMSVKRLYAFIRNESPCDVRRFRKLPLKVREEYHGLHVNAMGGVMLTDARIAKLLAQVDEFSMVKAELLATVPQRQSVQLPLRQKAKAS